MYPLHISVLFNVLFSCWTQPHVTVLHCTVQHKALHFRAELLSVRWTQKVSTCSAGLSLLPSLSHDSLAQKRHCWRSQRSTGTAKKHFYFIRHRQKTEAVAMETSHCVVAVRSSFGSVSQDFTSHLSEGKHEKVCQYMWAASKQIWGL